MYFGLIVVSFIKIYLMIFVKRDNCHSEFISEFKLKTLKQVQGDNKLIILFAGIGA